MAIISVTVYVLIRQVFLFRSWKLDLGKRISIGNFASGERELKKSIVSQIAKVKDDRIYWRIVEAESCTRSSTSMIRNISKWVKA